MKMNYTSNHPVNHMNYYDNTRKIYCKKAHKVQEHDIQLCDNCPYFTGSLQGDGVECTWDDLIGDWAYEVESPTKELLRVSDLIDHKKVKKG